MITELQLLASQKNARSSRNRVNDLGDGSALITDTSTNLFYRIRFDAWLRARAPRGQVYKSVAAVRSTGLRLLHFSTPKAFGVISPAGIVAIITEL